MEKAELPSAVHLAFYQLELVDLIFGLGVQPGGGDGGANREMVSREPPGE
jgi:hypothetical protein